MLTLPRGSAHEIVLFAKQMHENRGRVPRFSYFQREKVSAWELSDDFGTAYGPFLLVGETVVSRQVMQKELKPYDFSSLWRRVRDLNPRDAHHAYTISNRAPSTTQPTLHLVKLLSFLMTHR